METHPSLAPLIALADPSVAELARDPARCIELVRPHTQTLDANKLIRYFSDPVATAAKVLSVMGRLRSLEAQMERHAPTFDRSVLEWLPPAAVALAYLRGRSLLAGTGWPNGGKLLDAGARTRASLHTSAAFLANKGVASVAAVGRLQRLGNGYNHTSAAILGYIELHFDSIGRLVERSPLSREELDAARQEAIELAEFGARRNGRSKHDEALGDEKRRTYHLVVTSYNKVRAVVRYIRYDFEDADTFAPALGVRSSSAP